MGALIVRLTDPKSCPPLLTVTRSDELDNKKYGDVDPIYLLQGVTQCEFKELDSKNVRMQWTEILSHR